MPVKNYEGFEIDGARLKHDLDHIVERKLSHIRKEAGGIADDVQVALKEYAPVNTSNLERGLSCKVENASSDEIELVLKSAMFYWLFPEFGTYEQPPQPFVRPSLLRAKALLKSRLQ